MKMSSTSNHKVLTCGAWHRLGRGNLATQLPTPMSGNRLQPSCKLGRLPARQPGGRLQ